MVFAFCACAHAALAQDLPKYWIFFDDKPHAPVGETLDTADPVVSQRALERRARRGDGDFGWFDRPVSAHYVAELRNLGIEPVIQSRWLNGISAHVADSAVSLIRELEFVRDVRRVAQRSHIASIDSALSPDISGRARRAHFGSELTDGEGVTSPLFARHPYPDRNTLDRSALDAGPSQTQLTLMNADAVLKRGINGTGVRLGFLDTPFDGFQHEVFAHLVTSGRLIEVRNFVGQPQGSLHGMHVASVAVGYAGGSLIGPAHGAEVLGAVTEYAPTETNQEEDFFVAGLEWLESMGVDVVNVSLGYTTFDEGQRSYTPADMDGDTGVTTIAADRAASLGVTIVVSAGNSACSSPEECWYYVGTPADADSVIAVGAVRSDSVRSSFSSFGPTADGRTKPDVAALGSAVYVAIPDSFAYANGTSFSSPLVAGVVCQMLQVNPWLRPMEIRSVLRETASQAHAPDDSLGWGIIDAAAAIELAESLAIDRMPHGVDLAMATFPNPATDRLVVHITVGAFGAAKLTLFDALGRQVLASEQAVTPGQNSIDLSVRDLAAGLYLLAARFHGEQISKKLIVQ